MSIPNTKKKTKEFLKSVSLELTTSNVSVFPVVQENSGLSVRSIFLTNISGTDSHAYVSFLIIQPLLLFILRIIFWFLLHPH
jgi:hypothetical protein